MFDPNKLYLANDPALRPLGSYMTRAHWRNQGRGPAYVRAGRRILYRGSDLNAWLESRTVRPVHEQTADSKSDAAARA